MLWSFPLFPLPLLLAKLGIGFIILVTLLNVGALILAINDFTQRLLSEMDKKMFNYSHDHFVCIHDHLCPFLFNFNSMVQTLLSRKAQ